MMEKVLDGWRHIATICVEFLLGLLFPLVSMGSVQGSAFIIMGGVICNWGLSVYGLLDRGTFIDFSGLFYWLNIVIF